MGEKIIFTAINEYGDVNLYAEPSIDSDVLEILKINRQVSIRKIKIEKNTSRVWGRLDFNAENYWCDLSYLTFNQKGIVQCSTEGSIANIRDSASASGKKVGTIDDNSEINIIGLQNESSTNIIWCRISIGDSTIDGNWISSKLVTWYDGSPVQPTYDILLYGYVTKETNYYPSLASTVILGSILSNEVIEITDIGYHSTYGAVCKFELGWIPTTYLVLDSDKILKQSKNKNLNIYPYYYTTKTINGITFTDNGDGTITANGTATADAHFRCQYTGVSVEDQTIPLTSGFYTLWDSANNSDCRAEVGISYDDGSSWTFYNCNNGAVTFEITSDALARINLLAKSGKTIDNLVLKPQLERGSTATDFIKGEAKEYTLKNICLALTTCNIYSGAGTGYDVIGTLNQDEKINIISITNNGAGLWYETNLGYVQVVNLTSYLEDNNQFWISDGQNFYSYKCYIDNGIEWEEYSLYVKNESDWEKYS